MRFIVRHFNGGQQDAGAAFEFAGTFCNRAPRRESGPCSTA